MLISSATLLASLAVAATIVLDIFLRSVNRKVRGVSVSDNSLGIKEWLREQRSIVDFTFFGTPQPPLQERLDLRAAPNQRLVSAFGITNSLTTSSIDVHNDFRRMSSEIISPGEAGRMRWSKLYKAAESLLHRDARDMHEDGLALADCTQRLCLAVVLVDNFGLDVMSIPINVLRGITKGINSQWLSSKCDPATPKAKHINDMLDSLALKGKNGDQLTAEEVLSIIMPQYETLWRVVLLTFVTAYHRQYRPHIAARVQSVPACLGDDDGQEREVLKIAEEGLRLYPSNKRIYRASDIFAQEKSAVSADVEQCHRNPVIWGADALDFRPERFDCLTKLQKEAYFPYSFGRHRCPAYRGFGNRMITMLVVAMGRVFLPEVWKVRFHDSLNDDAVKPLPTGREDMDAWTIERKVLVVVS